MRNKGVEQKPSQTALFAALHRTIANKTFKGGTLGPDYLAECFLPPHFRFFMRFTKMRNRARNKLNALLPGLHEYMIARTAFFDDVFKEALNSRIPQIVLLGAGYDTRAYRFVSLNHSTRIFEIDIEKTQNRKKGCLKKAQIDINNTVSLIPMDFNKQAIKTMLEKAGYKSDQKALFLWEGVTYYLDPDAVQATLDFLNDSSHPETRMALDYAVSVSEADMDHFYGVRQFVKTMKKRHSDELFKFSIEANQIQSYFGQRGLTLVQHLNNEEIEKTFLEKDNGSTMGQITGLFRFAVVSPGK